MYCRMKLMLDKTIYLMLTKSGKVILKPNEINPKALFATQTIITIFFVLSKTWCLKNAQIQQDNSAWEKPSCMLSGRILT